MKNLHLSGTGVAMADVDILAVRMDWIYGTRSAILNPFISKISNRYLVSDRLKVNVTSDLPTEIGDDSGLLKPLL